MTSFEVSVLILKKSTLSVIRGGICEVFDFTRFCKKSTSSVWRNAVALKGPHFITSSRKKEKGNYSFVARFLWISGYLRKFPHINLFLTAVVYDFRNVEIWLAKLWCNFEPDEEKGRQVVKSENRFPHESVSPTRSIRSRTNTNSTKSGGDRRRGKVHCCAGKSKSNKSRGPVQATP